MKKVVRIIIFYFLFCLTTVAQSIQVEYDIQLNILNRKGVLNITNNETPFYYEQSVSNNLPKESGKESSTEKEYDYVIGINKLKRWYQIYSTANNTLYNIEYVGDKRVVYYDTIIPIKWTFLEDEEVISGYNCLKATTVFRGRNYSAWFTPDIPVNVGPWKFSGLPGLILKIQDEKNNFSWVVTKVSQNLDFIEHVPDIKNEDKLSFKEFVHLNEKEKDEQINKVLLRLSDKAPIIRGGKSIRGRELKYEWEE